MDRYMGMDVHAGSCTLGTLDARGKQLRQDVVETNGRALVEYLRRQPGQVHLCLEESEWAPWLWEILGPHVTELVVCRPGRRKGARKSWPRRP